MKDSFDILAADYRPMVLAYLKALVRHPELAEDLTQETLLAAHKGIESFGVGGNFGAWLRGIARNKMKEHFRASNSRPLIVDSRIVAGIEEVYLTLDASPRQNGAWLDRLQAVRICLQKLNDNLRTAVEQVYLKEFSIQEAADELGTSFDALAKRLSRARNHIRVCVAKQSGEVE